MKFNQLFIKKLLENWIVSEVSNLKVNLWELSNLDKINSSEELYFVTFIPSWTYYERKKHEAFFRTSDKHVAWTNVFKADFDVRSNIYEKEGRIISPEELESYLKVLENKLQSNPNLKDYTAIINSGNWYHVYRIWERTRINSKAYYGAACKILDLIDSIMEDTPELKPDRACTNISRLMRLPWSMNKKLKYWLPPQEVKVVKLYDRKSKLVWKLPEFWKTFDAEEKQKIKTGFEKLNEQQHLKTKYYKKNSPSCSGQSFYEAINCDIDIRKLVCKYTWREMAKNWINFISSNDWWFTGAYVIPGKNVVVWRWTPHLSDTFKVYSPYAFILVHHSNGDTRKAFEWAKENWPHARWIRTAFYFYNSIKYNVEDI